MKFIQCPHLGNRPITEFDFGGVLEPEPEVLEIAPGRWAFEQDSRPMTRREWWFHRSSKQWFLVERNTKTNETKLISET